MDRVINENEKDYSRKMNSKERKRMFELLQGSDAIDQVKVKNVVRKNVKTKYLNLYVPEKWYY